MDMPVTLALLAACAAVFGLASWRAARPTEFGKVRMVPWTAISLVAALAAIIMLVHAVNLLGVQTGQTRPGGMMR
jgi:ABC-type amino acid transport system permease subunit